MSLLLLAIFAVLLVLGAPVAVCLGLSSAVVIIAQGLPVSVLAQRSLNALDSSPLLAVPLFIFAANTMNAGKVSDRLLTFALAVVGRLPGGLAQVNILTSLIFSGSRLRTAASRSFGGTSVLLP